VSHRLAAGTALVAAALIALTACSSSGGKPSKTTPPTSTSTSSTPPTSTPPTTSSTPADPSQRAVAEATAFVPIYEAELDTLYSNPTVSINDIYLVAVQPEATDDALGIAKYRQSNYRQAGSQKLVKVSGVSVHMSGLGGPSATAKYPTVQLTACVDVSGVKVTDAKGHPVGNPKNPPYLIESLTIVNIKYPSASGWRVSKAPNKQAQSCGA
jgi:hypothetical protein